MPLLGTTSTAIDSRASAVMTAGEIVAVNFRCGVERETTCVVSFLAAATNCRESTRVTASASSTTTAARTPCAGLSRESLLNIPFEVPLITSFVPSVLREDLST